MAEPLLEPEFLSRLEYLYVVTRDLFVGHTAAERVSKRFGVGQEFADYRSYVAGDDYRLIDWAAYARRDALVIKLFAEEQEVPIYLFLDASRSMSLGSPDKLLFAKKVAAALGYIGLANLDSVEILPFDAALRPGSRQFNGRAHLRALLGFLSSVESSGATDLGRSMREFVRRQPARGLMVMLSDFLDRAGYEEAIRLVHYHRFQLLAVQINGPDEIAPQLGNDVELVDSETGEAMVVKTTPELLVEYKRRFEEHYSELRRLCQVLRAGHVAVSSADSFEELVLDVFRRREFIR